MISKLFLLLNILVVILAFTLGPFMQVSIAWNIPEPVEIHVQPFVNSPRDIKYSPNGELLAVAVYYTGIHVYNTQTLEKVYHLTQDVASDSKRVYFSPDGQMLATYDHRNNIYLWNANTGEPLRTLRPTIGSHGVTGLAFSPDGKTIASSHAFRTVCLREVETGDQFHILIEHTSAVTDVAFSPDGKMIASCGVDGLRVWDPNTGKMLYTRTGTPILWFVLFSPDGKTIATGNSFDYIILLDAHTGDLLKNLKPVRSPFSDTEISSLDVFSPDGKLYASELDGKIHLWSVSTGKLLRTVDNSLSVAFSPNNKTIATGSRYGSIHLWNTDTDEQRHTLIGHSEEVRGLTFSPDGKTLASVSRDGTVLLWNIAPSQLIEDVNNDGVVNIQDLVAVAQAFGEAKPDLNGDGVVNIQDLVIVARAFGNTVPISEE